MNGLGTPNSDNTHIQSHSYKLNQSIHLSMNVLSAVLNAPHKYTKY